MVVSKAVKKVQKMESGKDIELAASMAVQRVARKAVRLVDDWASTTVE